MRYQTGIAVRAGEPMEIHPYFCVAWGLFVMFMLGFSLGSALLSRDVTRDPGGREIFRAPVKEKEELLWVCLFLWSILFIRLTAFLFPKCEGCFDRLVPDNGWIEAVAVFVFYLHGFFIRFLFGFIQWGKARRHVHRFLNDCCAEGLIRAIYERTSRRLYGPFEWVLHDMMRDEHDLWQITGRAINGFQDDPVYIAMNIPPENVLQRLEQYNLVTKNGYERLPPPQPDHYFPKGGSMLHFYCQAEYVRIWG